MPDLYLQPSVVSRLLHLLQAAQPFLTPSWNRLAELVIRFLNISDLIFNPRQNNLSRLFSEARSCSPSDDMQSLLCAIRPFCSEDELQMLHMYEQFRQMQQAMEMWQMFSDFMPGASPFSSEAVRKDEETCTTDCCTHEPTNESQAQADFNPLLSFLSPEQLALYNDILSDSADN